MSIKTIKVTVCDCCFKELTGRLTFRTCPICDKDVCLSCIDKENAKHKPRERKPKFEPLTMERKDPLLALSIEVAENELPTPSEIRGLGKPKPELASAPPAEVTLLELEEDLTLSDAIKTEQEKQDLLEKERGANQVVKPKRVKQNPIN